MNRYVSAAALACAAGCVLFGDGVAFAAAQSKPGPPSEPEEKAATYARKGTVEIGGSVSVEWDRDQFLVEVTSTLGWFVADRWELAFLPSIEYRDRKQVNGSHLLTSEGSFLLEPSYHLPLKDDALFAFGGVGVGVAYDFSNVAAAITPRVGLNIKLGRSGVFTPAVDVPILLGKYQGHSVQDPADVLVGVMFEAGFTTTF
jgi:hypothetical protein